MKILRFKEKRKKRKNKIVLEEEVMQSIVSKEAIEDVDASVNESNMVGYWTFEDVYERMSACNGA